MKEMAKICRETFAFDAIPAQPQQNPQNVQSVHNAQIIQPQPNTRPVPQQPNVRNIPQDTQPVADVKTESKTAPALSPELIYIIKQDEKYKNFIITGVTTRDVAHEFGLCHLTVIVVPFIADGLHRGKIVLHDRTAKLEAKKSGNRKSPSYNLFGGHCVADITKIGHIVTESDYISNARRELSEELLKKGNSSSKKQLETWKNGEKQDDTVGAEPFSHKELISLGITANLEGNNKEYSYYFALPISESELFEGTADISKTSPENLKLVAADSYHRGGEEHDVYLPICIMSEIDLLKTPYVTPNAEICDAFTRLWKPENAGVYAKLKKYIQ